MTARSEQYGNRPLARYSGRIREIEGEVAIASLIDPNGIERNVVLALKEIEAREPIKSGNIVYVDVFRANDVDPTKEKKECPIIEKKYIL